LAIELAAGRLGVLSPAEVVERLGLTLFRSGRTDRPERQATLAATLDWSWDLLDGDGRAALSQLGVFEGGFALDAADAVLVLPSGAWPAYVVGVLVERSLVTARGGRFALLGPVREYALGKLADPATVEARHGAWYAGLAP